MFFPAGILASLIGVMLWPLVYAGWLDFYPAEAHARLMIEGFVGGFALGFLGTAFPKMIDAPALTWPELCVLLSSFAGCVFSHAIDWTAVGDSFFVFTWIIVVGCLAVRLAFMRGDLPPPGFVLAGMGLASGIVGAVMLLVGRIIILSDFQRALAHLLLYEGFIIGPIVGVGGFIFPRFFASALSADAAPRSVTWERRALGGFFVGLALLGTYLAQASGFAASAPVARAVIVGVYLLSQVPAFRRGVGVGSLSFMLRASICCLLSGILFSGLAPGVQGVGLKHVLFIGGYGLLILAIASRVTWGHSGNIDLAEGKRRSIRIIVWIVVVAMATRVVADLVPTTRVSHHIYAALLWVIAVAIWSWGVLRYVRMADRGEE